MDGWMDGYQILSEFNIKNSKILTLFLFIHIRI